MAKITRNIFFRKLRVQITAYYAIVSLLIVVIISGVYYYSASNLILDDTQNQTLYAVEQSANDLESFISNLKQTAVYISEKQAIKSYLESGDPVNKDLGHEIINQAISTNSAIVSVVIVGKNGDVLSNESKLEMSVSNDMMSEPWYVNALDNQQMPALTSARLQEFTMDKDTWVIALSQEIFNDSGDNLGVVLLDIKYQVIENYLDHLPLGDGGFAYIIDQENDIVYHPDPSYFLEGDKKDRLIEIANKSQGFHYQNDFLKHNHLIPNTQWTLVGLASLDRLDIIRRQLFEAVILIGSIILLVMLVGSYMIAKKITKPILSLQNAMGNFNQLKTTLKVEAGCYEVESLTKQFNQMYLEIQRLVDEIKANEKYLRSYELNALYSQINPHFLYNTLDTIVWMAEFNDSQKVIEVTKSLAQFFRISLSSGQEMISLENEFDHVKQYLFIQKQRYGQELNYDVLLEENIKEIEVPKIILQPIVENAIYHGIREQSGGGKVTVTGERLENTIVLCVIDDGVGFDTVHLKQKSVKLGGVGMENVKKRLELIYGQAAKLEIESKIGQGTQVTIKLPIL